MNLKYHIYQETLTGNHYVTTFKIPNLIGMLYDLTVSSIFHTHVPDISLIDAILDAKLEDLDILENNTSLTALEKHLATFGIFDKEFAEYVLDDYSMFTTIHSIMGFEKGHSELITSASMLLPPLNGDNNVSITVAGWKGKFSVKEAIKLIHPLDSGFYIKGTGQFDEKRFNNLKRYTFKDNGKYFLKNGMLYISETKFRECLQDLLKEDHRWDNASFTNKKIGGIGNTGEVSALFEFMRRLDVAEWLNSEAHIPLPYIKEFYINTPKLLKRIMRNKFPEKVKPVPVPKIEEADRVKVLKSTINCSEICEDKNNKPDLLDRTLAYLCEYAASVTKGSERTYFNNTMRINGEMTMTNNKSYPGFFNASSAHVVIGIESLASPLAIGSMPSLGS